jgi:hypothetical protein
MFATIDNKAGVAEKNPTYRGDFYSALVTGELTRVNNAPMSIFANKQAIAELTKPNIAIIGAETQPHPQMIAPAIDALVSRAKEKGATLSTVADETGAIAIRAAAAHDVAIMVVAPKGESTGLDHETGTLLRGMIAKGRAAYVVDDLRASETSEHVTTQDRIHALQLATATAQTVVMAAAPSHDPAVVVTAMAGLNVKTMQNGGKHIATLSLPPRPENTGNADLLQAGGFAMVSNGRGGVGLGEPAIGFVGIDGKFEKTPKNIDRALSTSQLHMIASWLEPAMSMASPREIDTVVASSLATARPPSLARNSLTARDIALITGAARHPTPDEAAATATPQGSNDNDRIHEHDAWRKVFEEAIGDGRVSGFRVAYSNRVQKTMGL